MTLVKGFRCFSFYFTFFLLICTVCSIEDGFKDQETFLYSALTIAWGFVTYLSFKNCAKKEIFDCLGLEED
jgi:hypothetical protein